jgi:surface antigen
MAKTSLKLVLSLSLLGSLLAPLGEAGMAYADPPSWAPAHGYRDKHDKQDKHDKTYQKSDNDDEEEDARERARGVAPKPAAPYGIAQGTCNRQQMGQVLGAATGVAIGSQIGKGNGNTVAMVGGAIIGAMVGGNIGQSMDRLDQGCVGQILEHAPDGKNIAWTDSNTGRMYQVMPEKAYQTSQGQSCRKYLTHAMIDGRDRQVYGTACRQSNGAWQMMN